MVSTRFAGLDGVSLETEKVARVLTESGHDIAWFAGELGPTFAPGIEEPAAHFSWPDNLVLERDAFGGGDSDTVRSTIDIRAEALASALDRFVDRFELEALIVQNAWAIPMQLPLAVAIDRVVRRRSLPAVGHHHDFWWERARFDHCVVPEILTSAFPPVHRRVAHVVINSDAADDLRGRTGAAAAVLPNVMDFEHPPSPGDGDAFRRLAGVAPDATVFLQPTRVIPRKGIELTIDLAARISRPVSIVVTHPDDLDPDYWGDLRVRARDAEVDLRLVDAGRTASDLANAYAAADIVCFPSLYEGYGNALVETFYFRRPVVVNRYRVYERDIAPLGVDCVELDGEVRDDHVRAVEAILADPASAEPAVERNYTVGLQHLSHRVVDEVFATALSSIR